MEISKERQFDGDKFTKLGFSRLIVSKWEMAVNNFDNSQVCEKPFVDEFMHGKKEHASPLWDGGLAIA